MTTKLMRTVMRDEGLVRVRDTIIVMDMSDIVWETDNSCRTFPSWYCTHLGLDDYCQRTHAIAINFDVEDYKQQLVNKYRWMLTDPLSQQHDEDNKTIVKMPQSET